MKRWAALAIASFVLVASAEERAVLVKDAWAEATSKDQRKTLAFAQLKAQQEIALVGARSPLARSVELHLTVVKGDVTTMQPVPRLLLAAGSTVALAPSGYHWMLMDLAKPLRAGDEVPLLLDFEDPRGQRHSEKVVLRVRAAAPAQ
jgi:copper(I)-binding protein